MALIKQKTTNAGVSANYWSIVGLGDYDKDTKSLIVRLGLWISEDAKKVDNFSILEKKEFRLNNFNATDGISFGAIYDALKAIPAKTEKAYSRDPIPVVTETVVEEAPFADAVNS